MQVHFDLMRSTLVELKAKRQLRDVDVTVAAFGVLGMILWLPRWFRHGGRLTENEVAEEIADIALGGLLRRPDGGRRRKPQSRRRARAR